MRILRQPDYRVMPWKNGGGFTTEIAVFPEDGDLSGFDWRISMAVVSTDGPFSAFPGIDRTLIVLEGEGMELAVGGEPPVCLTPTSSPLPFPADVATTARLVSGPITDLNIMTRRGRWAHRVERRRIEGTFDIESSGDTLLVLALSPSRLDATRANPSRSTGWIVP
ncbi:HutD family protein [Rhizobium sp. 32-5/1]|nr:HutD family protein [Rhizobium sp. 32-5/1]WEZ85092.1 HutD family protein [Rhizobium sp. 32-5/1]